jgi:hypothetical protein
MYVLVEIEWNQLLTVFVVHSEHNCKNNSIVKGSNLQLYFIHSQDFARHDNNYQIMSINYIYLCVR